MNAMGDLKWLIGVIVVLGVVSFALNSPSDGSPRVTLTNSDTQGIRYSRQADINRDGVVDDREALAEEIRKVEEELEKIQDELQKAQENANSSAYRGKVTLEKANAAREVEDEYVRIKVSRSVAESIPTGGWRLESPVTGKGIDIVGGTKLLVSGQVNRESPIVLEGGQTMIVSTGRSPVGASFRTNICTGYLEQFQDFAPRLRKECPLPKDDPALDSGPHGVGDACLDYVENIPRCIIRVGTLPLGLGPKCSEFVFEKVNYNSCVNTYRTVVDFFGSEWRVYLKRDQALWKQKREVIKLLDQSGKLIDVITY